MSQSDVRDNPLVKILIFCINIICCGYFLPFLKLHLTMGMWYLFTCSSGYSPAWQLNFEKIVPYVSHQT